MKQSRFIEEQMIAVPREAHHSTVAEVARKHRVSGVLFKEALMHGCCIEQCAKNFITLRCKAKFRAVLIHAPTPMGF